MYKTITLCCNEDYNDGQHFTMNLESDSEEEDEILVSTTATSPSATENSTVQNDTTSEETLSNFTPSTKIIAAEESISNNEWNVESWKILFSEALTLPLENVEAARDIFERFLKRFPTSGRYWKFYALCS